MHREGFAWTEAVVVLATIARRWWLRPVPGAEVRMVPAATLRPSQLPMVPRLRQPAVAPANAPAVVVPANAPELAYAMAA